MSAVEAPIPDPHALKHLSSSPIAARKVQLVVGKRNDLIRALAALELVRMFAQADKERRGGISAGSTGDVVSGSRTPSMPVTVTKKGDVVLKDARDREIDKCEREIERHLEDIAKSIYAIQTLGVILGATRAPSKREREQAADIGADCLNCTRPVACTPADRLRAGRCSACYQYMRDHPGEERPKELWT